MSKENYENYRGAMAYIEVVNSNGDKGIGSAFHLGSGVFITARHVVENNKIIEISTTEHYNKPDPNGNVIVHGKEGKFKSVFAQKLTIKEGPFYHPDNMVDIALIVVKETIHCHVELGGHLDDWIEDSSFLLMPVTLMGYPKIPSSFAPILFVSTAEINAIVDRYNALHPHFLISAMARDGFSGGLCLIGENVLGIVVQSLLFDYKPTELGYLAVLTVEPIYNCLLHYNLIPKEQEEISNLLSIGKKVDVDVENNDKPL